MASKPPSFDRLVDGLTISHYLNEIRGIGRQAMAPDPTTQPEDARSPAIASRVAKVRQALGSMATPHEPGATQPPTEPIDPAPAQSEI